ncbi:type I pullulanase [Metabacillus schmidteae]|uniref:type I pullulanase n=1 Tax=Metabacillus schmidteae TaxID=2730405 RepID=UPI00158B1C7D|nr:type I pullulanase [Metabacillus schmidteae]
MLTINRSFEAFLDRIDEITILIPKSRDGEKKNFSLSLTKGNEPLLVIDRFDIGTHSKYVCKLPFELQFGKTYIITDEQGVQTDLQIGAVIRTVEFDQKFAYAASDLGVHYSKETTKCKVWAPTATHMKLRLYDKHEQIVETYDMVREEKGTWSITLDGDFDGYYYTYLACINLLWNEAVDPYTKAVSINGKFGVIIDEQKINIPKIDLPKLKNKTDAIIYEAHIRDFSIHENSGLVHKGKYEAWLETGTKNGNGDTTGITYLKKLGVTHIELLPVNDFEEVDERNPQKSYNWGYNPLHFFAPEGSYSLNPEDPYKRIIELKSVIQSLHNQGLKVILDVVFNHVYSKEHSSFEKLLPGYYFRYDENGISSNGTGVGNDLASERYMVRKLIVDCVTYWMKEYDVDGFRFDLMGIHDVETMNQVETAVLSIKQDAFLLGEGWDLNTPLPLEQKTIIKNAHKVPSISFFNDQFRDVIKGSTFSLHDTGFVYENADKVDQTKLLISGSPTMFHHPDQSINYVESHDNHTMWDRFSLYSESESKEIKQARHRLATSIVLLSQGVPFLHAGQEFFRTKKGVENSYNSPDHINCLNWNERSTYKDNVEYIRGLIKVRKQHGGFRLSTNKLIEKHLTFNHHRQLLSYQLKDVGAFGPWDRIYVVHHNQLEHYYEIRLPGDGDWMQIVSPTHIFLESPIVIKNGMKIDEIGTYVFCKN